MVSREFIHSVFKAHHVIAVHMKGEKRLDSLSTIIFEVHELLLDENEEQLLITNRIKGMNTHGLLRVKAVRTSEVNLSLQNLEPQEYVINTMDIVDYEFL